MVTWEQITEYTERQKGRLKDRLQDEGKEMGMV